MTGINQGIFEEYAYKAKRLTAGANDASLKCETLPERHRPLPRAP